MNKPEPPDGFTVCESDNFVVKAHITNIGCADAYNVYGRIEIGEGAILAEDEFGVPIDEDYWYIGDLAVGDTVCVAWNLHCNQSGVDVPITVYATSSTEGLNQFLKSVLSRAAGQFVPWWKWKRPRFSLRAESPLSP